MKIIKILIIGLIFLSCRIDKKEEVFWINPEINFTITERETPIKQYPYDHSLTDNERRDSLGLIDFFNRMNLRFIDSKYLISEAEKLYLAICNYGLVGDESYGMPSPEDIPVVLTLDDIKSRVSILKLNNKKCEAYSWNIGCGRNFNYIIINFNEDLSDIIDIEIIERWSASYPC